MEEVSAQVLRDRMHDYAQSFLPDLYSWATFDVAWVQRYAVTTLCRILHTRECGRVTSKKTALEWGRDTLDSRWSALIEQVMDDRSLGFDAEAPPRPGSVAQTMGFLDYAQLRV